MHLVTRACSGGDTGSGGGGRAGEGGGGEGSGGAGGSGGDGEGRSGGLLGGEVGKGLGGGLQIGTRSAHATGQLYISAAMRSGSTKEGAHPSAQVYPCQSSQLHISK